MPRERSRSRSRSRSPPRKRQRNPSPLPSGSRPRSRSRSRDLGDRKRRRRSRSYERERDHKSHKRRDRSISSSSNSSERSTRHRSDKRKGKHKERDRSRSKERRREKRREKRERREKKKRDKAGGSHWGKHGIITDLDIFTKSQEFHTWLVEERKINPETISKDQQKKEFARFVEDFNTATLPHEKYYDMEAYDKRMSALRQGEYLPPSNDAYDFGADMKAISTSHRKKLTESDSYLSREQLEELRKVQNQRTQMGKMKILGMDVKQNFGVRMDGSSFDA